MESIKIENTKVQKDKSANFIRPTYITFMIKIENTEVQKDRPAHFVHITYVLHP